MKRLFIVSILSCLAIAGYAQNETNNKVVKKTVKKNFKLDTKTAYNYFLLDIVRDVDSVYSRYEGTVQDVWSGKNKIDLKGSSNTAIKDADRIYRMVQETNIYQGGDEYQKAVLTYIEAVKEKIRLLEIYGILGADPESDAGEYDDAAIKFHEATNDAIDKRNKLREKKSLYEKTVYMKVKK